MTTTLFIISAAAFALAALSWFCTWAIWIHPPEGWFGRVSVEGIPVDPASNAVRHASWYRWLKVATGALGVTTLALLGALIWTHRLEA